MIAIGQGAYRCLCREVLPLNPLCGDRGVEDDE
jgi:hypothetical protein